MARLPIPINFGRADKTSPKHAPFGVLKSAKNLRHREAGGLGMRNAYVAQPMTSRTGTVVAYDLHEFQGRLLALGSDVGDGYPAQLFEFLDLASERWRSAGATLNPFTNAREVAGVPQAEGGVQHADCAHGGGYTCLVYRAAQSQHTYALIVDSTTNQAIALEDLTNHSMGAVCTFERVAYAGGKFFICAARGDNSVRIVSFELGVSTSWATFADVDGANAAAVSAADFVPVGNATTALLAVAFDRGSSTDLSLLVYKSDGTQLGSTITVSGTNSQDLWLDANQADNTILLFTIETATDGVLRTFDFSGSVVAGPTATTSGVSGTLGRRRNGSGADLAFVGVNDSNGDFVVQAFNVDTHAETNSQTIGQFIQKTRLLSAGTPNDLNALVVGGIVGIDSFTNALLFFSTSQAHMVTRDYLVGVAHDPTTITYDATTGTVAWLSVHNPGVASLGVPAVTLLDFKSTARVQAVNYGGLRYFAGATPWVYDGRVAVESCFNEAPGIVSVTPGSSGGSLTAGATYTYAAHWEFTFADGSYIESPPSIVKSATLGGSDNRNTIVATTPHSIRVAQGPAFGMTATFVLSRTEWSPTTIDVSTGTAGVQFSLLRRAQQVEIDADITAYGDTITVIDQISDSALADEEPIYTQSDRGEFSGSLEHNAPQSCVYIDATESRLINGGLVRPFEAQVSKEAFLGQPFAYSELSNFFGTVSASVRGVHALDGVKLVFTSDDIYALGQEAPDDEGKGALGLPSRLRTPSGLKDWRSFLEGPDGLWCQLDDDKVFRIPSGAGTPSWEGAGIVNLLRSYPTITGTARHKEDNAGLFALNNAGLTDARIAVRDFEFGSWLVDEPPLQASSGIEAMTALGRTVAYISGGVVYLQSATSFADNGTDFIDLELETQPIYPFGIGGYGVIQDALITCEYRGDCTLTVSVSYDEGVTYSDSVSFEITGYSSGAPVRRRWALPKDETQTVTFKVEVTELSGATEGMIINQIDLLQDPSDGLPELLPGEAA